jgi:prepilin signal peptidase PulO-like enzyme (type II secretory pathway)
VHRIHYRFSLVLVLILATVAFQLAAPEGDGARFVAVTLQAAVLVAAVVASRAHPVVIRLSLTVATIGIVSSAAAILGTGEFGTSAAAVVALLYLVLTPPALIVGLRKQFQEGGAVTMQTMFGVLCLYLLIGLMFGVAFAMIQQVSGTDFFNTGAQERDDFLYFSYTTLTTVGYGDLVAATELGRSLAITEALLGQLYLVSVVAVIVANLTPARRRAE